MANKVNVQKRIEKINAVYAELVKGYPVTVKEVARATGVDVRVVREARDYLVDYGYIRVSHFGKKYAVAYESTRNNRAMIFGSVTSVTNDAWAQAFHIEGYTFDYDGDEVNCSWDLSLDNKICKQIADYVKANDEVPFF